MFRGPFFVTALLALMLAGIAEAQQTRSQAAQPQAVADKEALLQKAQDSYYSLHREGLVSFRCNVTPDWEALMANERRDNPEAVDNAVRLLRQLRFTVTLAADSRVKITHNELSGQSQEMNKALAQIYSGMEDMTSGFFDTWKLFVLDSPFPEVKSTYKIDEAGSRYRLSYREDKSDILTTFDKNLAILDINVKSAAFTSTIQPSFRTTPKGYLLGSYNASYKSADPKETTKLNVQIGYMVVAGLQLVQKLKLDGSYGGDPYAVSLAFSNCSATTKAPQVAEIADPPYPARSPAAISAAAAQIKSSTQRLQAP